MKNYSLDGVEKMYSYYGKSPIFYKISSFIIFFGAESFLRKRTVKNLELKSGDVVLDVACGMGGNFDYLLKKIGNKGKIFAVDYSSEMIMSATKLAARKGYTNIKLIKMDVAKLDFPSDCFDGIISTIGFSSIPDYKEALDITIKSLKKGKRIAILDAGLFRGHFKIFNPLIKILRWPTRWDKEKEFLKIVKSLSREVRIEYFLGGSFYLITGIKR